MFEKEAEEYLIRNLCKTCLTICENNCPHAESEKRAFQDGAEFGYKYKENEWHYVKDGVLPKESGRYFVYVGGGEDGVYPLDFDTEANDFGYWCLDVGDNLGVRDTIFETITERNEDKVIAWKEIKLPEQEG